MLLSTLAGVFLATSLVGVAAITLGTPAISTAAATNLMVIGGAGFVGLKCINDSCKESGKGK